MRPDTTALLLIGAALCASACTTLNEVQGDTRPSATTLQPVTFAEPVAKDVQRYIPERRQSFSNPPDSPVRTPIIGRLPALIGRYLQHIVDPQTTDRSHIMDPDAVRAQFDKRPVENSITWIGHMTTLINVDGRHILTDPWWSNYGSPIPGLGPRRYAPPALAIEELPPIDVIVVSHSHYDHFDLNAISRIRNPERITAVVPLGLGRFFRERGYGAVYELDWEQTVDVQGLSITALPAIHWSQRQPFRKNDTLWASFAIEGPSGIRIFFGGDTDYGPVHARLARRWGGFDAALLSIGGFHNDGVHCAPRACVELGTDMEAKVLIPLHWGTIYLGEGPPQALADRFTRAAVAAGMDRDDVWSMRIGETRALPPVRGRATQIAGEPPPARGGHEGVLAP